MNHNGGLGLEEPPKMIFVDSVWELCRYIRNRRDVAIHNEMAAISVGGYADFRILNIQRLYLEWYYHPPSSNH